MPTLTVAQQELYYVRHAPEAAQGVPLLLVHGAGGSHLHWPPHLRRLPKRAVYALDLPGHGRSAGAGLPSIDAYAGVVRRFVDKADLPSFILGGHSMGAAIGLQLALETDERLTGLALIGAGARLRVAPAILEGLLTDYAAATAQIADLAYGAATSVRQRQLFLSRLRETDPAVLYGDFVACNAFDARDRLPEIDLPTLILCGEEDRLTPPKHAEYLAAHLPHGELHMVAGAGHMAMLEQPDRVTALLCAFAARCDHPKGYDG